MILKFFRNFLGMIIVFFDWVTRPKSQKRTPELQAKAQSALEGHSLYQLYACPFCVKTRRALHSLGVRIDIRDINKEPKFREELDVQGGRVKVPCLRIEEGNNVRWMYESKDIINYLKNKVSVI